MTTDDERVAYLAGEDGSDLDDPSRADLDDLRDLLGDSSTWATPGPGLEDAVVAAIAAERAAAPASRRPAPAPTAGPPGATPIDLASRRRRIPHLARNLVTAAAAVAVLAVGGFVLATRNSDDGVTSLSLEATDLAPDADGRAELRRTDSGWRIEIDASGLPRRDGGEFYEAWLKSGDGPDAVLVPIGTFNEGGDVVLWAGVSPVDFPILTVTQESADGDQGSSGQVVLRATIDLEQ
ncbi:MAG: anti-sigma factor [Ilumatobacteraceae bacterium]